MPSTNDVEKLNQAARLFIEFVTSDERKSEDDKLRTSNLIRCLDRLSLCMRGNLEFDFDDADYPEAPEFEHGLYYQKISANFPVYRDYNFVAPNTDSEPDNLVSDPIDDLTDICSDIWQYLWRLENNSLSDALFDLDLNYFHWGRHLRNLQSYLHAYLYES
jgi:Domain of unknown function (DUF5063)